MVDEVSRGHTSDALFDSPVNADSSRPCAADAINSPRHYSACRDRIGDLCDGCILVRPEPALLGKSARALSTVVERNALDAGIDVRRHRTGDFKHLRRLPSVDRQKNRFRAPTEPTKRPPQTI